MTPGADETRSARLRARLGRAPGFVGEEPIVGGSENSRAPAALACTPGFHPGDVLSPSGGYTTEACVADDPDMVPREEATTQGRYGLVTGLIFGTLGGAAMGFLGGLMFKGQKL